MSLSLNSQYMPISETETNKPFIHLLLFPRFISFGLLHMSTDLYLFIHDGKPKPVALQVRENSKQNTTQIISHFKKLLLESQHFLQSE